MTINTRSTTPKTMKATRFHDRRNVRLDVVPPCDPVITKAMEISGNLGSGVDVVYKAIIGL